MSIGGHGDQATPSWKEDPSGAFAEASKLKFFPKAPRQLLLRLHELMKGLVGVLRTICLQVITDQSFCRCCGNQIDHL